MNIGDLFLQLLADGSKLEASITKEANAAAGKAGTTAGNTLGSTMGKNISRGFTAVGAAGGAMLAGAIESGAAFEDQLRTINTVAGLTDDELGKVGDEIQGLSRETGKTTDDLTAGFYDLVSAGVPAEKAISVLKDSAVFATGALGTTGEAVDLVTSAMNAYGLEASDSTRITDIFAKAVQDGKVTAAELGASIANIAPIAASAGVSLEEVSSGFALLTAKGVPAAQAATQMRASISALLTPNKQLNDIQEETGINFAELAKAEGLAVALDTLREATNGNEDAFAKSLGSIEAYQFALATTGDNAEAMAQQIVETGEAQGIALDQYTEKSKSSVEQGKRFAATLNTLAQDFGGAFAGAAPFLVTLNQLGPAFNGLLSPAKLLGGAIGGIFGKVLTKIPIPQKLADKVLSLFGKGLAQSTATAAVTDGLATATAEGVTGLKGNSKISAATSKLGQFMGSGIGKGLSVGLAAVGIVGVIQKWLEIQGELDAQSAAIGETIAEQVTTDTVEGLESKRGALQAGIQQLADMSWWNPFADFQRDELDKQLALVNAQIEAAAKRGGVTHMDSVATGLHENQSVYASALDETVVDPAKAAADAAAAAAEAGGAKIPESIAEGALSNREKVGDAMDTLVDLMHNVLRRGERIARDIGILTSQRLADGLKDKNDAVRTEAERVQAMAIDELQRLVAKGGDIGKKGGEALAKALKSKNPQVRAAAQALKATLDGQLDAAVPAARDSGVRAGAAFAAGAQSAMNSANVSLNFTMVAGKKRHRQHGGPVVGGAPYLVNENTPNSEVFVPSLSGHILTRNQAAAAVSSFAGAQRGGGGDTIINMPVSGALPVSTISDLSGEMQRIDDSGLLPTQRVAPMYHRRLAAGPGARR